MDLIDRKALLEKTKKAEMTEAYFENPDVKRRYEEWEKEQESKDL